ncbi:MAG TPA: hypothetical protein VFD81_22025 [Methylomirabilota bacterium]|nr:hypothetical protein [Methylomirabilota bacterium]
MRFSRGGSIDAASTMTGTPRRCAIAITWSSGRTPGGLVNGEIKWATAAVRSVIASSSSKGWVRRARPISTRTPPATRYAWS